MHRFVSDTLFHNALKTTIRATWVRQHVVDVTPPNRECIPAHESWGHKLDRLASYVAGSADRYLLPYNPHTTASDPQCPMHASRQASRRHITVALCGDQRLEESESACSPNHSMEYYSCRKLAYYTIVNRLWLVQQWWAEQRRESALVQRNSSMRSPSGLFIC